MSKIINKILNDKNLDASNRVRLTREWLQTEYRLKDVKDVKFLQQLSEVHDHDNLALHFGEVNVGTAFEEGYIRIVEVNEGWHLAFSRKSGQDFVIVHPNHEKAGLTAENLKNVNIIKALVKKGSVKVAENPAALGFTPPVVTSEASVMTVSGFDEKVVDESALTDAPIATDNLGAPGSTTSLVINMDDYLK